MTARGVYLTPQWFAEQGFAVVIADGRGTPARGPAWEHAVAGDLADPVLEDQVDALHAAAASSPTWTLTGWRSAAGRSAATWRRWRCCVAPTCSTPPSQARPVTDWRLYDTHYTERYLGHPDATEAYERSSLDLAERAVVSGPRPLLLIHGLADDNVVVAHTLRLSSALLAAGRTASGPPPVRHHPHGLPGDRRREHAPAAARLPAWRPRPVAHDQL